MSSTILPTINPKPYQINFPLRLVSYLNKQSQFLSRQKQKLLSWKHPTLRFLVILCEYLMHVMIKMIKIENSERKARHIRSVHESGKDRNKTNVCKTRTNFETFELICLYVRFTPVRRGKMYELFVDAISSLGLRKSNHVIFILCVQSNLLLLPFQRNVRGKTNV